MLLPVGIVAAISIPAFQDYTIRAQVAEGLNLAAITKAEVAERYAKSETWRTRGSQAQQNSAYVESIEVANGSVLIRYGNRAHALIGGKALAIAPGTDSAGNVIWACGEAAHAPGVQPGPGVTGSEVDGKYLPQACRAQ
jgi:type IV pilus assembly protein PilA